MGVAILEEVGVPSEQAELLARQLANEPPGLDWAATFPWVKPALEELRRQGYGMSIISNSDGRVAERLAHAYDDLERRIVEIAEQEELNAVRPDLDGTQVMEILGIRPGPVVGRAYKHLLEWRLDEGPHEEDVARAELLRWWAEQPESAAE